MKWLIFEGVFTGEIDYKEETSQGVPYCTFELIPYEGDGWLELGKDIDNAVIATWSKTATICYDYLEEGMTVRIKGRMDSVHKHTANIVAQEVSIIH